MQRPRDVSVMPHPGEVSEGGGYVRQGASLNPCGFIKSRTNPEETRENWAEGGKTGIEEGARRQG